MKQNKTISLDAEIIEFLDKVENGSGLINELLKDYFGQGKEMKRKELEQNISKITSEIMEKENALKGFERSLKELEEKEAKIKETFKNIPNEVLEDFARFPEMSEESLKSRYNLMYWKYQATFNEILEAFRKFKADK